MEEQAVIWSIPVLALAVLIEFVVSRVRGKKTYRGNDTLANLSQGVISQLIGACTPLLQIGIYTLVFSYLGHSLELPFWHTWYGFAVAVVMFDFCEYWLHRVGHEVSVFWAAHVVHHQSEELNICTALRQESQNAVLGWPFYLPLAVAGVPPEIFAFSLLFVQYYQIWAHTEQIGKLGWIDGIFSTPSNHRVHHAVNDCYIDRNYGGLFVLWDRMFGTYAVETERCVFGTRSPVRSFNPLRAITQVYAELLMDCWHAERWQDKLKVWFMPPGWRPADVQSKFPKPGFDVNRERYDPPASKAALLLATLLFLGLSVASGFLLWYSEEVGYSTLLLGTALLLVGYCGVGELLDRRSGDRLAVPVTSPQAHSSV
jgi:sterol desaturase/sphingolipid hydroxylase (fatty acid hydroxylase superfamily)